MSTGLVRFWRGDICLISHVVCVFAMRSEHARGLPLFVLCLIQTEQVGAKDVWVGWLKVWKRPTWNEVGRTDGTHRCVRCGSWLEWGMWGGRPAWMERLTVAWNDPVGWGRGIDRAGSCR